MNEAKQKILDVASALGLTMTAEFVPWSQSRNSGEDRPSLNWKVTIKRMAVIEGAYRPGSARHLLTSDYMAGCAHCPSYKQGDRSVIQAELVAWECEKGFTGHYSAGLQRVVPRTGKPIMPEFADVLYSLALDYSVLDAGSYEEWASDFGYDPDSRKGEAVYKACLDLALKLRNGIGEHGMEQLRKACEDY